MTWLEDRIAGSTVLILAEKHCSDVDAAKEFCLKAGFTEGEIVFELVEPIAINSHGGSPDACQNQGMPTCLGPRKHAAAAKDMVAHESQSNTLVVFSKITCPPCTEVKIMFEDAGFTKDQTNIVTISNWPTMEHIQDRCREVTGDRGTPRVWINGKIMGGFKEIKPMFEDESLHEAMTWLEDKIAGSTVLIVAEKHCSDVDAAKGFCLKAAILFGLNLSFQ
eukprot:sb/3469784/